MRIILTRSLQNSLGFDPLLKSVSFSPSIRSTSFTWKFLVYCFQKEKERLECPSHTCCFLGAFSLKSFFCQSGIFWRYIFHCFHLLQYSEFSRSVVSDSLRPHELQHARPPCPSPTPGVHSDSRPSSQ